MWEKKVVFVEQDLNLILCDILRDHERIIEFELELNTICRYTRDVNRL